MCISEVMDFVTDVPTRFFLPDLFAGSVVLKDHLPSIALKYCFQFAFHRERATAAKNMTLVRNIWLFIVWWDSSFFFENVVSFWISGQTKPFFVHMNNVHHVMKQFTIHMDVTLAKFRPAVYILRCQIRLQSIRTRTAPFFITLWIVDSEIIVAAPDARTVPHWLSGTKVC